MSRFANAVTPSPQKRAGRRRLLSAVILLFLLSALCPDARADQNSEVDSVLLDAMKKTYEFDKAERTEERLLRGGRASRPGGPNAEELYAKGRACIVLEEYERAKDFFSRAARSSAAPCSMARMSKPARTMGRMPTGVRTL